jgi:hypothetical protein
MGTLGQPAISARALSEDSRLKLHLRLLTLGRATYRVVTLRPGTKTAFSTNFFHQTWHIVTSRAGARLLARLLWGLSYERHPGTLLLVHGDHLLPTPFEAERSDPFLLAPAGLTRLDASHLRLLKNRLNRLGPPTRTIRWQTFGLDVELQARENGREGRSPVAEEGEWLWRKANRRLWRQERMERLGGIICYSAPPAVLRQQALRVHGLRVRRGGRTSEMDYHFLAESPSKACWYADGEVQIFADYMDRVAAAAEARRQLLRNPNQAVLSETMQEAISRRRDQIKARRAPGRRRWQRSPSDTTASCPSRPSQL